MSSGCRADTTTHRGGGGPRRVLMLGTSPDTMGGIASVVRVYRAAGLFARWPVTYLPTHADGTALRKLGVAVRAFLRLALELTRGVNVVLHVHSASRASFWRKCALMCPALWCGKPVIFHLHGGEFLRFYHNECGAVRKRFVRYVLGQCTRIIVLSESWRTALASIVNHPAVEVVMNPVTDGQPAAPKSRDAATILFMGRVNEKKGIYLLLEAMAAIKPQHPRIHLVCAGSGEIERVRRMADQLGVSVHLPGWVGETERRELLNRATVFVLPSLAEGLPMSVLEAMAAGVPVIATAVGGVPDVIRDGKEGVLVEPGDRVALATAIERLLEDSTGRGGMAERAYARFQAEFSPAHVLSRLEAIYSSLGVEPWRDSPQELSAIRRPTTGESAP